MQAPREERVVVRNAYFGSTICFVLIGSIGYIAYVMNISEEERENLKDEIGAEYAPLLGYFAAQFVFGSLVALPISIPSLFGNPKNKDD